jgi:hypothetical protein
MHTRTILGLALGLAALTTVTASAIADAAPSRAHHQRRAVGRIASISGTSVTINGTIFVLTARQLAGLAVGQCVEVESRVRQGASSVRTRREDRCSAAATTPVSTTPGTTPVTSDDSPQHDLADDDANGSADDTGEHGGVSGHGHGGSDD